MLIYGGKDIENRSRCFSYRGPLLIHSSHMWTSEYEDAVQWIKENIPGWHFRQMPAFGDLKQGGIIGRVTLTACLRFSESPWYQKMAALVIKDPQPLEFMPCKGSLGIFEVDYQPK